MPLVTPAAVTAPAKSVTPAAPAAPAKPAAAKAAPAKAPAAAPAKPAPKAKPTPESVQPKEGTNADWLKDIGAELDELDAADKAVGKPKAKEKPAAETELEDDPDLGKEPEELVTKPKEKGVEKPKEDESPKTNADLRKAFDRASLRIKDELEPKLKKYEERIKELESREPQEVEPLRQKLTEIEKRNAELEKEIGYVNYSSSKEFQDKYAKPYIEAFQSALQDVQELTIEEADGSTRKATEADLLEIANMELGSAVTAANAKFGDAAQEILAHRRILRDLGKKQNQALAEAREKGDERTKQAQAEAQANSGKMVKMWKETNQQIAEKYPNWFAPEEGDEKGNAILAKGRALAARAFEPTDETRPKSPEEAVRLHALIFNKAANHDRLAHRLNTATARIKELEEALKQFEDSEPGAGRPTGPGGKGAPGIGDYESEIDELDKKGPIG